MIVLGIDPGPRESALVWWDGAKVQECRDLPNREAAKMVGNCCAQTAVEWFECFGMEIGQSSIETIFAIGIFSTVNAVRLVPRRDVKQNLCRDSRAKDKNIRQALIDRFGPVGTKKSPGPLFGISNHLWSALAVAVTAFDLPDGTPHEATFHRD